MPRYEQLKSKSKSISYTRQIRNESKEINLKKPIIISVTFIIAAALIFTVVKKYSPMVDIAIKDFFSINHKEAMLLESDGVTEDQNKMSFLNNIPLFNFFIKADTNETLSVMAYETNSKIETSLDMMSDSITNSSIITKESLLPFFNNSGSNNSILYDSGYVDYGNNHESVIHSNNMNTLNRIPENNVANNSEENIIVADIENTHTQEEKTYNYLEQMILENRQNNNVQNTNMQNNTETKKGIFDDILKPKDNITKRETTTMKPASTTTFSTKPPASYVENTKKDNINTNESYNFDIDKYLNNNDKERVVNNNQVNNNTLNNDIKENTINDNTKKSANNTIVNNNTKPNRKDIMQTSVYTMTNSLDKPNIDYNRVIKDMVNPNNNNPVRENNTIVNNSRENNNNSIINKPADEENNTKESIESTIAKNNELKDNIKETSVLKNDNIIKNNNAEYKKEIIKKAQNDINNYNIKKANNNITRDIKERKLKENSNEGIYLVEYSESTGSITLIFRERKFNNKSSVEEAIKELLIGATDEENNRNIISCIPKDTELLDIFIENNTVYLNFNENFEFNPLGNEGTMVQIYQLVYTATQFEGIDNVIFLINGQLNETIGAEGAIENMPFTRFE
ncbi:hypothetical protein GQX62_06405 [Brachyspira hyodysenteriae]|uniref:GerMN domain-containing protein n=1 Tax=Brachyspira hyodysenteriae TaxID=159 RepID=UPI001ADDC42A|nr:GerMN domain-containing protein [Brachyspira hyodysenteriae]MCZ9889277.1 GerMN domain-containing protein [Brachyspira hyodysenteriae]QTM03277.1 hypothetical protein GQX62_06405 [Brachyspira hyodysenteriae]QTM05840.1 hypothetical protein GQX61_06380 [Brachyspira hyodysenteriae]